MTIPGILQTARTLSYYERMQELTANNLANVSTDGFKADRMTAHLEAGFSAPIPVTQLDLSQGAFLQLPGAGQEPPAADPKLAGNRNLNFP